MTAAAHAVGRDAARAADRAARETVAAAARAGRDAYSEERRAEHRRADERTAAAQADRAAGSTPRPARVKVVERAGLFGATPPRRVVLDRPRGHREA